jgi:LmbE family N-acetylglucosaminyl deacetylase
MSKLKDFYDHLFLSPHFDDVALSCGGQVFRHTAIGDSVLVVTVTAAEPPDNLQSETVESLHRRWTDSLGGQAPESIVAHRRAEDRAAFHVLRADVLHLPFLDCIYRQGPDGMILYPGPTDMFGAMNPADEGFIDELASALGGLPQADRIYLPLGVGGHIDHGVARQAGERVFGDVVYYEDYPYTMAPDALEAVLPPEGRAGWMAEIVWLTETALAAKIKSVAAYRSQLSSFFTGTDDLAAKLREDGRRVTAEAASGGEKVPAWTVGGERLWRRAIHA